MSDFDLLKRKKKENILEKKDSENSDLFEEPELDLDSDHPVHEEFVSDKRLREIKKKGIRKI